jgi:hypothetical protein
MGFEVFTMIIFSFYTPSQFTFKKYLKAKEELWKFKYFTMQKYNLQKKIPLKETKILQDIITP